MLHYFSGAPDKLRKYGCSIELIWTSFILSVVHICMELFIIHLEAKACRVHFFDYCVTCYNGRLGFVPFTDYIASLYENDNDTEEKREPLDYGQIQSDLCCIRFNYPFKFTAITSEAFSREVGKLEKRQNQVSVAFGRSVCNVPLDNLIEMLNETWDKVQLQDIGQGLYDENKDWQKMVVSTGRTDGGQLKYTRRSIVDFIEDGQEENREDQNLASVARVLIRSNQKTFLMQFCAARVGIIE